MRTSTWMLLGCLLACNLSAHADGSGAERYRTLTVETVYPFKQTDFDPPVALAAYKQSADSDPMTTLQRHFAAMRGGDVNAFLSNRNAPNGRVQVAPDALADGARR